MKRFNDTIWGTIEIEEEFLPLLEAREVQDMRDRTQLGLSTSPNALHTRYQHSLGVYHLVSRLIGICKEKFSDVLTIDRDTELAIKCMALVHDIGHGPFSHVTEQYLDCTHEERAIRILQDSKSEIHKKIVKFLGQNVLRKTIELLRIEKNPPAKPQKFDLIYMMSKLLAGGIDVDRMDYIFRDAFNVTGEKFDYSKILEYISLEYIDDSLEIVFDEEALYLIINFFNRRFELYDSLYMKEDTRVLESIFHCFIAETGTKINGNTTEAQLKYLFETYKSSTNIRLSRMASLLCYRNLDSNFIMGNFSSESEFSSFKKRITGLFPDVLEAECFFQTNCTITYSNVDKVLIRQKSGLVVPLSECSPMINTSFKKSKHSYGIDLYLLVSFLKKKDHSDEEICAYIRRLRKAISPEIEQEKKYTFDYDINPVEGFKKIRHSHELGLENMLPTSIINIDTYFDYNDLLAQQRINVRKRVSSGKEEWTIKKPLEDRAAISKRIEKSFSSKEEVIYFIRNELAIDIPELDEVATLKTSRIKYIIQTSKGRCELVFDKTIPFYNGKKHSANYMVECELVEGSSIMLMEINSLLQSLDILSNCNKSKKEIAVATIRNSLGESDAELRHLMFMA